MVQPTRTFRRRWLLPFLVMNKVSTEYRAYVIIPSTICNFAYMYRVLFCVYRIFDQMVVNRQICHVGWAEDVPMMNDTASRGCGWWLRTLIGPIKVCICTTSWIQRRLICHHIPRDHISDGSLLNKQHPPSQFSIYTHSVEIWWGKLTSLITESPIDTPLTAKVKCGDIDSHSSHVLLWLPEPIRLLHWMTLMKRASSMDGKHLSGLIASRWVLNIVRLEPGEVEDPCRVAQSSLSQTLFLENLGVARPSSAIGQIRQIMPTP